MNLNAKSKKLKASLAGVLGEKGFKRKVLSFITWLNWSASCE